jgi:hypothetical protein
VVDASTAVGVDAPPFPSRVKVVVDDPEMTVTSLALMIVVTSVTEVLLPVGGTTIVCG